jgi:hypothetical protein
MNGLQIGHKLNKAGKENLIFKYEVDSYEDLVLHNNFLLSKVSKYHRESNLPNNVKYLNDVEEKISKEAIKNRKTNFNEDDVTYEINELGYRTKHPVDKIKDSIGVFGCSYTFGVGVPHEHIFTTILENKLGVPVHNFGIPGGGIQKLTKSFTSINSLYKLKTAIFVLPSLYRYEFINRQNNYTIEQIDFIPNFKPQDKENIKNFDAIYSAFDDITFLNEYCKHLNIIKMHAKLSNTKIYFTTWCNETEKFIRKYNIENFENKILFYESYDELMGKPVNDFARDGMHPGIRTHFKTSEIILKFIDIKLKLI